MDLIIVESPTKAKTIGKFLSGKQSVVMASKGHLRDLPKSRMGVDTDTFEPEYINIRGKGTLIQALKKTAAKADRVFLATDNDREGEAIAWHLSNLLGLEGQKNRIEFNEITKTAITEAMKHPRVVDEKLFDSQQARRILDRVVGYSISPILWSKVQNHLSAGRVQSVALFMIVEREKAISAFIPEEYWKIYAHIPPAEGEMPIVFELKQIKKEGKWIEIHLSDKRFADQVLSDLSGSPYTLVEKRSNTRKKRPFPPFTTSQLQQDANRKCNFRTDVTMRIAQSLYEGIDIGSGTVGLITYMRTDSTRISEEALKEAGAFIRSQYPTQYYEGPKRYTAKTKGAQDAHEAIRPTDVTRTPESIRDFLSAEEYKLYRLIWNRFVQSQMSDAEIRTDTLKMENGKYRFQNSVQTLLFDGYMRLNGIESGLLIEHSTHDLPLTEGKTFFSIREEAEQLFTKPPARYTEASIIKALEDEGIGRPSTYAPIIGTLKARKYIRVEKRAIYATELGITVSDILHEQFPKVVNVKFTAEMEQVLDDIANGGRDWKEVLQEFYRDFKKDLEAANVEIQNIKSLRQPQPTDIRCDICGKYMVIREGRYGKFLACSGFPECKHTKPILETTGTICPKCQKGDVVKRKNKNGRIFYGCSRYPECDFLVNDMPIEERCPKCGGVLTEKKRAGYTVVSCCSCEFKERREKKH